jgi:uncharacterized protein (DUF433 family)
MARYPLNLPQQLKQEAEEWARQQGVSLNQFILWATAEKVGGLKQQLDDPQFPQISYRRGAAGSVTPVIRGAGIRVQTIVIAHYQWGQTAKEIAQAYDLDKGQVAESLDFYAAHTQEIDRAIAAELALEPATNE